MDRTCLLSQRHAFRAHSPQGQCTNLIIKHSIRPQLLHKLKVPRTTRRHNTQPTQLRKLNRKHAHARAAPINQQRERLGRLLLRPRQLQRLVHALPDGDAANAVGRALGIRDVVRELDDRVALADAVLAEGAGFRVVVFDAVGEAGDAVALFERLGDARADFDDRAGEIAADGEIGLCAEDAFPAVELLVACGAGGEVDWVRWTTAHMLVFERRATR